MVRWPVGGIRTYLRYVYRKFSKNDWEFTIIAPDLEEVHILINEDLNEQDIRFIPVDASKNIIFFIFRIVSAIKSQRFDIVHSHGFTSGTFAALPAALFNTYHIITSHDVINDEQFKGIKGILSKKILGNLFSLANTIQSVSMDAQNNLLSHFPRLGKTPGKCIVVQNGIEVKRFIHAIPRNLRGELQLGPEYFLIGFLGRFMSQKGFRYLIDAIEIIKNDKSIQRKPLVLTFGEGGFAEREKRNIAKRQLDQFFRFMPFASNVASTIKGLDVVVMPSLWEACGLLAMETLACGVPLIASDCIGLREVIRNTPTKVSPKGDASKLAEQIKAEMISSSRDLFQDFHKKAADLFCSAKTIASIKKIYDTVNLD